MITIAACSDVSVSVPQAKSKISITTKPVIKDIPDTVTAAATAVMKRKQVPILCYHQLREWRPKDSKVAKDYIVPPGKFAAQLKMLADNGFTTILPDELMVYLNQGTPIPPKSFMLTFDDTDLSQFDVALKEMDKYGFKGVFFIMTVSIGRPGYMTAEQIRTLSEQGHVIGCHTWDHHNVKKYTDPDWTLQLEKPLRQLEKITGKPVKYFAYPFGLWNEEAIAPLQQRGIRAAFQLSEKRSVKAPLYTIRRIIVPGYWENGTLDKWVRNNF
jgi:peptidoglycan/xylan/chitin deacetylase (PgdA/CDA1 family)